jgi:hypothetical protein
MCVTKPGAHVFLCPHHTRPLKQVEGKHGSALPSQLSTQSAVIHDSFIQRRPRSGGWEPGLKLSSAVDLSS